MTFFVLCFHARSVNIFGPGIFYGLCKEYAYARFNGLDFSHAG